MCAIWEKIQLFRFLKSNIHYNRGQKSQKSVLYYSRNLWKNHLPIFNENLGKYEFYQKQTIIKGEKVKKVPSSQKSVLFYRRKLRIQLNFLRFQNQIYTSIEGKKVRKVLSFIGTIWGKKHLIGFFFGGGAGPFSMKNWENTNFIKNKL